MSLLHEAYSEESVADAWNKVRARNAGPGVDGVTVSGFARRLERNLAEIRKQALAGTYKPDPVLRCHIPKSDGDFRRIGIPTVRDRVAQRALLNSLLTKVDPRLSPSSYAYRPGRSVRMAVAEVERLRNMGNAWTARVDIDLCFDSIPHDQLLREVDSWIGEKAVTALIRRWLEAGYIDSGEFALQETGVPQGDVLSPVLSNIYLDGFDRRLAASEEQFVRYADDILIVCRDRCAAQRALARASDFLTDIGLKMDPAKSGVMSFNGGFKYLGTLFVRSMAIPAVRIERADGSAMYTSGYESRAAASLAVSRGDSGVVVTASGGELTERRLSRLVAKELYLAMRGRGTAVGLALLEAWQESQAQRRSTQGTSESGPGDWAFVA